MCTLATMVAGVCDCTPYKGFWHWRQGCAFLFLQFYSRIVHRAIILHNIHTTCCACGNWNCAAGDCVCHVLFLKLFFQIFWYSHFSPLSLRWLISPLLFISSSTFVLFCAVRPSVSLLYCHSRSTLFYFVLYFKSNSIKNQVKF